MFNISANAVPGQDGKFGAATPGRAVRLVIPVLAAALGGCTVLVPDRNVPEVVSRLPETFPVAQEAPGTYRPRAWWHGFEDNTLNALVDEALDQNLDLAEAAARVERASAQAHVARASLFPSISAGAGSNYSDTSTAGTPIGKFANLDRLRSETYSLSLGASYEVDLFGRARSNQLARRADARAAEHDFRAVQLATAAETIATYFEIVDTRRQIELALVTADVLADRVERTEERYLRGLVESYELYQVRQELRTAQAALPLREETLDAAEGRLAVLLRDYPQEIEKKIAGPLHPRLDFSPVPAGLPVGLLAQRPDVAAAWERLDAARLTIGARRAERFPAISLSGSIGTQGDTPGAAFKTAQNWALTLASNIVAPIFDGGRIAANVAVARADYDARAAAYARAVLEAYREVTSATEQYEEERQRYRLILAQLADAEASLDLQARRFGSGVGSYIAYLDSLRAVYQVRASLSAAARGVALARLGVHRALAGDWTSDRKLAPVAMSKDASRGSATESTP